LWPPGQFLLLLLWSHFSLCGPWDCFCCSCSAPPLSLWPLGQFLLLLLCPLSLSVAPGTFSVAPTSGLLCLCGPWDSFWWSCSAPSLCGQWDRSYCSSSIGPCPLSLCGPWWSLLFRQNCSLFVCKGNACWLYHFLSPLTYSAVVHAQCTLYNVQCTGASCWKNPEEQAPLLANIGKANTCHKEKRKTYRRQER
jgi:hypothetical protein